MEALRVFIGFLFSIVLLVGCAHSFDANITFLPSELRMGDDTGSTINLIMPGENINISDVMVTSSDNRVIQIGDVRVSCNETSRGVQEITGNCSGEAKVVVISVDITASRLGKAEVIYVIDISYLYPEEEIGTNATNTTRAWALQARYDVIVFRIKDAAHRIFYIGAQLLVGFLNFSFGCHLDVAIIWSYVRRPVAPIIGLCSQFFVMPLLGIIIAQIFRIDFIFIFGLLTLSCSPGGGSSNSWAILLDGDINLSLTMTSISLVLALGMMPLWMFVMSCLLWDQDTVEVPYFQILLTLFQCVGPCLLGLLLKRVNVKYAKPFEKLVKPVSLLFLLWIISFGFYVNFYVFEILRDWPLILLAGLLLPWCGFGFGFLLAKIARQGLQQATTIAIETGVQNVAIPIILLERSFPQPEGDMASVVVHAAALLTPVPLFLMLFAVTVRKRWCSYNTTKRHAAAQRKGNSEQEAEETMLQVDIIEKEKEIDPVKD